MSKRVYSVYDCGLDLSQHARKRDAVVAARKAARESDDGSKVEVWAHAGGDRAWEKVAAFRYDGRKIVDVMWHE